MISDDLNMYVLICVDMNINIYIYVLICVDIMDEMILIDCHLITTILVTILTENEGQGLYGKGVLINGLVHSLYVLQGK